jgi:hypothetical protein
MATSRDAHTINAAGGPPIGLWSNGTGPCLFGLIGERVGAARVQARRKRMNNIFYIIGVIVVVLVVLGYLGLR